jgi:hypothetical protein
MVVSYFPEPNQEPLVLDNLDPVLKPASMRTDLLPVYSFNGTGVWEARQNQTGVFVDSSKRLSRWQNLLKFMDVEAAADQQQRICLYQYYNLSYRKARAMCGV